ncbi:MAG: DJ-1/PfpI family protein, partial [Patescibacteria group bacterium]
MPSKKIAMIVAFRDFRDEEYFVPKEILESGGIEVKTVSNQEGEAIGAEGGEAKVDILLENLNLSDFDGIIFVGGPECLKYLDNENSYRVIREAVKEDKLLAAICISPVVLAKAGVLAGKKATVWSSPLDKSPVRILKDNGVLYQEEGVVVEGKIITAEGPQSA